MIKYTGEIRKRKSLVLSAVEVNIWESIKVSLSYSLRHHGSTLWCQQCWLDTGTSPHIKWSVSASICTFACIIQLKVVSSFKRSLTLPSLSYLLQWGLKDKPAFCGQVKSPSNIYWTSCFNLGLSLCANYRVHPLKENLYFIQTDCCFNVFLHHCENTFYSPT